MPKDHKLFLRRMKSIFLIKPTDWFCPYSKSLRKEYVILHIVEVAIIENLSLQFIKAKSLESDMSKVCTNGSGAKWVLNREITVV